MKIISKVKIKRKKFREYDMFENIFLYLKQTCTIQKKVVRANQQPYMTKVLRKAYRKKNKKAYRKISLVIVQKRKEKVLH